jgi:chromosome segregation ATPase
MNGATRLQEAQAQVLAAEVVIAQEHEQSLHDQYDAARAEGRQIQSEIDRNGVELVNARQQAEPLWVKREQISKARAELDKDFAANDFPSDDQIEAHERKRTALTEEWHEATEKITLLSGGIARLEEEFRRLKFARSRSVIAVNDLKNAIAERRIF